METRFKKALNAVKELHELIDFTDDLATLPEAEFNAMLELCELMSKVKFNEVKIDINDTYHKLNRERFLSQRN